MPHKTSFTFQEWSAHTHTLLPHYTTQASTARYVYMYIHTHALHCPRVCACVVDTETDWHSSESYAGRAVNMELCGQGRVYRGEGQRQVGVRADIMLCALGDTDWAIGRH